EHSMPMKTGLTHFILPQLSTSEFMHAAAKAGYDSVELNLTNEGELTPQTTSDQLQAIVDNARNLKLELSSMGHLRSAGNLLQSGDSQKQAIHDARTHLKIASALGIGCTLHTLGKLSADLYYEDAWNNAIVSLKEIART